MKTTLHNINISRHLAGAMLCGLQAVTVKRLSIVINALRMAIVDRHMRPAEPLCSSVESAQPSARWF